MPSPETAGGAYGMVGWVETPGELLHVCESLRDAGYRRFDAHTPFPVHGLDQAMGLKPSPLPWIVLVMGLLGGAGALALQVWTHAAAYPQNISGKPLVALPAYVPVAFEATILLAAFGTFFGMWALNRLPRFFHPVMQYAHFDRASDDRFLVSIEASDPSFDREATAELLRSLGVQGIEEVQP